MNTILVELDNNKEPYIKKLTDDKIINITGESGSGKSYYAQQYQHNDNYIIIDTDDVFARYETAQGYNREFGTYLRAKYAELPSLYNDFDLIYTEILTYFKDSSKIIVIDSALLKYIKDISNLRGILIIMRTSVNTCYQRCLERFNQRYPDISEEKREKYAMRKKGIYKWYKKLNSFIEKINDCNTCFKNDIHLEK